MKMRATWDALASDPDAYVGDPTRGRTRARGPLRPARRRSARRDVRRGRLRPWADDRRRSRSGSTASSRSTSRRRCSSGARVAVPDERVEFRAVSGERLDGVDDAIADVARLLPRPAAPALARGRSRVPRRVRPRSRSRAARRSCSCRCSTTGCARARGAPALGARAADVARADAAPRVPRRPAHAPRARLGPRRASALRVVATDVGPDAPYRYSRDLFLRLTR